MTEKSEQLEAAQSRRRQEAIDAICKESERRKCCAEVSGVSGWIRPRLTVNQTFLRRTLGSAIVSNCRSSQTGPGRLEKRPDHPETRERATKRVRTSDYPDQRCKISSDKLYRKREDTLNEEAVLSKRTRLSSAGLQSDSDTVKDTRPTGHRKSPNM
ncbi:hypothetical protein BOX15_Mlig024587g1 [Macrostomum lignano]|uniref:Uncharacterized protein n=1 Tax=Macrostomum lignano TaxID=282301 RepID=A0A267G5E6_9PLAT|nr:hypothetical protein BOX15_Mlig024587g1 [Macrostomum lignano]